MLPVLSRRAWSVHFTSRDLPHPSPRSWHAADTDEDWELWLDEMGIPDGTPFILGPDFSYDTDLNSHFHRVNFLAGPINSQRNRATALCAFLNFLHRTRGVSWRDATESDHDAFLYWRRHDLRGPRIGGDTWSQDVSHLFQFYKYASQKSWVAEIPIPQRESRAGRHSSPGAQGRGHRGAGAEKVPASYAHDGGKHTIEWFPPASYRQWRDVGVLGYSRDGLPRNNFRGRWASRNAVFCDLMVRTGMRLEEQASLLALEVPTGPGPAGYSRFWLPEAIAKGGSARWIYVSASVRRDLTSYVIEDRRAVVEEAHATGKYQGIRRPFVITDPSTPHQAVCTSGIQRGTKVDVRDLNPVERRRLLVDTEDGLEPAMLWLGESGMPLSLSTWKDMFRDANIRCSEQGVDLAGHAHLLRHTFSVVTLEQLQRGHIAALAEMNPDQRLHYQRIFGDPLDWVRRRLGHRSVTTTLIYLHALQELEMETRMALVPSQWEDPRDTSTDLLGTEEPPTDLVRAEE